ncbi:MAG: hypothetical protein H9901_03005 [Candidatus Paralactobacillus gallistercoris]|uniref:Uncharacterized protein n=1 Tax=Candidatus Paralactobacillus gallistercoris TaxID=2838724 RepID=A0A948TJY5_9LACO|nr:hypothetical protein [Candidatus Paralactobacillus gallistercoris]
MDIEEVLDKINTDIKRLGEGNEVGIITSKDVDNYQRSLYMNGGFENAGINIDPKYMGQMFSMLDEGITPLYVAGGKGYYNELTDIAHLADKLVEMNLYDQLLDSTQQALKDLTNK